MILRAFVIVALTLLSAVGPAHAVTIQATNTINTGNCMPFGCPGIFAPTMGFTYQNVPAFSVGVGGTIRFDTAVPNNLP